MTNQANPKDTTTIATTLGFPRIGDQRQVKRGLDRYRAGDCPREDLLETAARLCQL